MGNKINSLRGREDEDLDEGGDVRARSISVGGSGSSMRAMSSSMSAPSSASRSVTVFFSDIVLQEICF